MIRIIIREQENGINLTHSCHCSTMVSGVRLRDMLISLSLALLKMTESPLACGVIGVA